MKMSEQIKKLRIKKGLTQEELALKLGLQKSAIAKYENGRVENIKRSTIQKMAEILECKPSYLMGWEDDNQTSKDDLVFTNVDDAMLFIIENPTVAAYGGYDLERMTNEEKIEFANQIADTIKFFGNKYNK